MVVSKFLRFQTKGQGDFIDITARVAEEVAGAKVDSGTATIFVTGSTAGITTIEFEPGALSDFRAMWERLIPEGLRYEHNLAWADANGHSRLRASLLGASLVVPFNGKVLTLGTWQQIVLVEFDVRPRSREVVIQIMGEP